MERAGERLDVLINNAGRPGPPQREVTADGNEVALQMEEVARLTRRQAGDG